MCFVPQIYHNVFLRVLLLIRAVRVPIPVRELLAISCLRVQAIHAFVHESKTACVARDHRLAVEKSSKKKQNQFRDFR